MSERNQSLSDKIHQVVSEHLEATQRCASTAVMRAFSSSSSMPRERTETSRPVKRTSSVRRSPAELSALGERLHEAVCAHPGESMSVLAVELGMTPRELSRPMSALKRAGRVRSVGQRHHTRYFPTVAQPVASAS